MQIRCPRCRATYEPAPGATTACPACGDSATAATLPDIAPATSTPPPPAGPAPAAADPLLGRTIGGYRILGRLGRGGMSTVYRADQVSLKRAVALKVPHEDLVRDARFRARFGQEARTLARVAHPGIVQIYDVGTDQGIYYIAMEYVEGTTLGRFLARNGVTSPAAGIPILKQCLAALARAHREKIVHRDIKPDNILIMRGGKVKITDFGLAKSLETASTLSLTGTILGTPLYMSPEQADGEQIDARSDLYSLGATFYHALTGRPPFEGPTPVAIVLKHVKETLQPAHEVNPAVPVGISNVLSRMLAKKPEDRYLSAEAVLADLEGLDRGRIPAAPARAVQAAPTRWNRKQILAAGGAAAACLIAAFAIGAMASRNGDPVKPVAPEPAIDTSEDARVEAPPPPPPPATAVAKEPARPPAPPPDSKVIVAPLTIEQAGAAIDSSIPQQPPDPPPPSLETPPPPPRTGRRGPLRGEDGFRPRPGGGRGDGMMDSIRKLPREPEPGTREALKAARESLKKSEPMAAVTVLRASRRMHADYIDEHPDVKSEYEKLTREAMSKIPPAMRRQLDEARGRFGRGRGGPPSPPSPP